MHHVLLFQNANKKRDSAKAHLESESSPASKMPRLSTDSQNS